MKKTGFTILEILISLAITTIILGAILAIVQLVMRGYDSTSSSAALEANARIGLSVIREDMTNRDQTFPITYSSGEQEQGWYFVNDEYGKWEVKYGEDTPHQKIRRFPNDQLGFFIRVPKEKAEQYGGKSLAHVLYYTAFLKTSNDIPMRPFYPIEGKGYTAALFRQFTPPDELFQQLSKPESVDLIVPSNASFSSNELGSISIVATEVVQFKVNISGIGLPKSGGKIPISVPEFKSIQPAPSMRTSMLNESSNSFSIQKIGIQLKLLNSNVANRMLITDWAHPSDHIERAIINHHLTAK